MRAVVILLACVSLNLINSVVQSHEATVGAVPDFGLRVGSDLREFQLVPLRSLPRSPEKGVLDEYCSGYRAQKQSVAARSVEKLGWIVTSEAPLAYCQGRAKVPDIYGKGINAARRMLFAQGWKPERPAEKPGEGDMAHDMAEKGLTEAEMCSGTGVGYCNWNYRSKAGLLHVVTVGGELEPADNTVSSYSVKCN